MPLIKIVDSHKDPKTSELVAGAFGLIPAHWQALLPATTVVIALTAFNEVPELKEFCSWQERQPGWPKSRWQSVQVICPEFDDREATVWVWGESLAHVGRPDPEYYLQKELYATLAELMWAVSDKLQSEARKAATGFARGSDELARIAFRDSFSRFFLNPHYLQTRKEAAWAFMGKLDLAIQTA